MSYPTGNDFNPYYKWLGIPSEVCAPNHYRLLGVELFEQDPEVIATAADRQMAHVKSFSTGPFARVSQRLLNELSQARICLLNAENKRLYDADLQLELTRRTSPVAMPLEAYATAPVAFDSEVLGAPRAARQVRRRPRRKKASLAPFAFLLVGIGIVASLLYYAATQRPVAQDHRGPDVPSNQDVNAATENIPLPVTTDEPGSPVFGGNTNGGVIAQDPPNSQQRSPSPRPGFPPGSSTLPNAPTTPTAPWGNGFGQEPRPREPNVEPADADLPANALDTLPGFVALPDATESKVAEIVSLSRPAPVSIDCQLEVADYIARSPRQLFLHASDVNEWLAYDETPDGRQQLQDGDGSNLIPFAKFNYADGSIRFQWINDPSQRDDEQRLKHCLLRIKVGADEQALQLRTPVEEPQPIDIGKLEEKYLHVIETDLLQPLPPSGAMLLALKLGPEFPAVKSTLGDADRLAEDDQLFLQFQQIDYAGVGAYWQLKGRRLTVGISPGFRLLSAPNDITVLSRSQVDKTQEKLVAFGRRTEKDHAQRVNAQRRLQNNLTAANNMSNSLPGGGTTPALIAQKNAAIAKAQRDIASNEERISFLSDLGKAIKEDADKRMPALRTLALELEGAANVGFEIYVPAGSHRVVIYRQGDGPGDTSSDLGSQIGGN